MGLIEYSSNNSGGSWWLNDEDWYALEEAGWDVEWVKDQKDRLFYNGEDGRFLGALATRASKETNDPEAAIAEWESVTGQSSESEGCNCCGEPHNFSFTDDDGNHRYSYVETVRTERRWS